MKLWLDDRRPAPEGWTWARTALNAFRILAATEVDEVSLDYDLHEQPCVTCLAAGRGHEVHEEGFAPSIACEGDCPCQCHRKQPNGVDLVCSMVNLHVWPTTKPVVHSRNQAGRKAMELLIDQFWETPT